MNNASSRRYFYTLILWMALIFISSSIPSEVFPHVSFWGWAKLVHLFYYAVLAFFVQRVLQHQTGSAFLARHSALSSIIFAILYGATDELHQHFTHGRHPLATDVLIDGLGACLYVAGRKAWRYFRVNADRT